MVPRMPWVPDQGYAWAEPFGCMQCSYSHDFLRQILLQRCFVIVSDCDKQMLTKMDSTLPAPKMEWREKEGGPSYLESEATLCWVAGVEMKHVLQHIPNCTLALHLRMLAMARNVSRIFLMECNWHFWEHFKQPGQALHASEI